MSSIILFASSRRAGNTGQLTDHIAKKLGIEVVSLDDKDISPFDYAHKNRGDDFEPLMDIVLAKDNIIFASPIYWYAVAPSMKIFLDRISDYLDLPDLLNRGRELRGKKGYVITTSVNDEPDEPFINAFTNTFDYLGMIFPGYINLNCTSGIKINDSEKQIDRFISLFQ